MNKVKKTATIVKAAVHTTIAKVAKKAPTPYMGLRQRYGDRYMAPYYG